MGFFTVLATTALAVSTTLAAKCTPAMRVKYSEQVGIGYNAVGLGASKAAFDLVPWGAPDRAGVCTTTIIPDGSGCAIPVATTGSGTEQFAIETRQLFYQLNNTAVIPFKNGTVLYSVEIQLGVRHIVPLPTTFHGYVYMDFNSDCRIYAARAYADIPTSVLQQMVKGVTIPNTPACKSLPIGGQKREAVPFEA